MLKTIYRVLKPTGKFYSYFGIYTKTNDGELLFEPKELKGHKYNIYINSMFKLIISSLILLVFEFKLILIKASFQFLKNFTISIDL